MLDMTLQRSRARAVLRSRIVVIEPGMTPLEARRAADRGRATAKLDEYGDDASRASMGAEADRSELLKHLDLDEDSSTSCARSIARTRRPKPKRKKIAKRLKLVEAFIEVRQQARSG
jgi:DNA-directed RNA polymerase subunit beta'